MAIYKTRKAKIERNVVEHSSVSLKGLICSRIVSEYKAAEYGNTVQNFKETWTTNVVMAASCYGDAFQQQRLGDL